MPLQPTTYLLSHMTADLTSATSITWAGGVLLGAKVIQFVNTVAESANVVLSDLTLATYTSYAPVAVTWGAPHDVGGGNVAVSSQLIVGQPTDDTSLPQQIQGIGLVDSGGTHLLAFSNLDSPVNLATTLDSVQLVMDFVASNSDSMGNVTLAP